MFDLDTRTTYSLGFTVVLAALLVLLAVHVVGCSEQGPFGDETLPQARLFPQERGSNACTPAEPAAREAPTLHTLAIDGENDFGESSERVAAGQSPLYHGFATWDDCRLFLGYTGPVLSEGTCAPSGPCPDEQRGASPFRSIEFYIDTDPLAEDGTRRPRSDTRAAHRLPFNADYLVTVRSDGRMVRADGGGRVYEGNAQVYKNVDEWEAGLTRGWEPLGRHTLDVAQDPKTRYLELAIDREALGDPCAIEVTAWVTDARREVRFGHWPAPSAAGGTADSVALNYYGFPLVEGQRPNASAHLNRLDYSVAGTDCAQRGEDHQ